MMENRKNKESIKPLSILQVIASIPYFKELGFYIQSQMAMNSVYADLDMGDILFRENDIVNHLNPVFYLLYRGEVKVSKNIKVQAREIEVEKNNGIDESRIAKSTVYVDRFKN